MNPNHDAIKPESRSDLLDEVRAAYVAAAKLRSDALGSFLDDWEAKHDELTPDELAQATNELTLPP